MTETPGALPFDVAPVRELVLRWRDDPGGTYRTWFLWDERVKNFLSIRRGIEQVSREIEEGRFGTAYKGSSLETVVHSIAEQRQMFKGADHAFLWKPKLRIPDIYEDYGNQLAFGRTLETCRCCTTEAQVVRDMSEAVAGSAAHDATPVDQDGIVHPDCVFLEMAGHSLKMDTVGPVYRGRRDADVGRKGPHARQSAFRRGLASCPVRPSPASDHPSRGIRGSDPHRTTPSATSGSAAQAARLRP